MASEIRVNQIQNRSGLSTVTFSDSGVIISGITTISDLRTSGTSVVAAGTTAAPSISPTGDSNTGIFFPSADTIAFAEGGAEALRIDSSGRVGIGSIIPENKLDVNGTIKSYSGTNKATFKDNQLRSDSSGTFYFDHGTISQSFTFRTSTSSSLDTTGPSITSAGNISFPSGQGLDFSATANSSGTMTSELLSDYEEGSFTPTIYGWTGTYAIQYGHYTKIGRQVFIHCEVLTNASTGSFTEPYPGVGNLPFAISSNANRHLGNWGFLGNQTVPANSVGAGQWDQYNSTALFPNDFKTNAAIGNWNSQSNSVSLGYRSFISYFVA